MKNINIRSAIESDAKLILSLIREIAEYEKLLHEVVATESLIKENLFGQNPVAKSLIAELDNQPVGYALYFYNFSTFLGRPGIYLEDLYVKPECRGLGIGKKLLTKLAKIAVEKNCGRVEWSVLDWNEPAIMFYRAVGAIPMDEWTVQRLTGETLAKFAESND